MKGRCKICNKVVDETQQTNGNCHDCQYRIDSARVSISLSLDELTDLCHICEIVQNNAVDQLDTDVNVDIYQKKFYTLSESLKFGIFSNWDSKVVK